MAEQVIIDIAVSNEEAVKRIKEATDAMASLKQQEKDLNAEYDSGQITMQEYASEMAKVKSSMEENTNTIKANKDAIKQNVREQQSAKDSLVAMRAELKKATTEFDNLSAAERNGAKGKALQQHISAVTASISSAEEATGRFQRNVGNYKGSIVKAFEGMGSVAGGALTNGIKSANTAMKMMAANPIMAALSALIFIITKIIGALKKNEDAFNKVKVAMSAFTAVSTLVQRVLGKVTDFVAKLATKLSQLLAKIISAKSELGQQIKTEQGLAKAEAQLEKDRRNVQEASARNDARIAQLRRQANEKSKRSNEERQKLLKQAQDLETANFRMQKDLASNEYKVIKARNEQAASGTKDLNAESEALKRVYETQIEYENHLSSLTRKQESLGSSTGSSTSKVDEQKEKMEEAKKIAEEYAKELERLAKQQQDNELNYLKFVGDMKSYYELALKYAKDFLDKISQKDGENSIDYYNRLLEAMQNVKDAQAALDKYVSDQQAADSKEAAAREQSIWDEVHAEIDAYDYEKQQYEEAQKEKAKATAAFVSSVGDCMGTLSGIFGEFADDNKNAAVASAALSLAQTYIAQAQAIANVVKGASALPFPANIAAIASSVATVVAQTISQIKTVKEQTSKIKSTSTAYATGGLIQGPGTGTSDSITARVSNGEFVVNAAATRANLPELLRMNGGWGNTKSPKYAIGGMVGLDNLMKSASSESMRMAMIDAVSAVRPVVSVREITNVQNKISAKERIARS